MSLKIKQHPLAYQNNLTARHIDDITMVVIHCTELPDLSTARDYGEQIHYHGSSTGNSGHFYIDRDGQIEQYVELTRIAHHVRGHNQSSIGIELVNRGRYPNWHHSEHQEMIQPYTQAQIESLLWLIKKLSAELPNLRQIAGHEDLDRTMIAASDNPDIQIRRKLDPGRMFPWSEVLDNISLDKYTQRSD